MKIPTSIANLIFKICARCAQKLEPAECYSYQKSNFLVILLNWFWWGLTCLSVKNVTRYSECVQKVKNLFKCPDKFIIGFMSSSLDIWKVHLILKKWDLFSIFDRLPFNKSPTMLKNPNGLHLDSWLWQHQKFCPDFELLTRLSAICNICWNFVTLNIILLPWIFFHMLLCVFE